MAAIRRFVILSAVSMLHGRPTGKHQADSYPSVFLRAKD
jgi:hypothetical protein